MSASSSEPAQGTAFRGCEETSGGGLRLHKLTSAHKLCPHEVEMIIVSMGGMIIMFAFGDDGKERERRRWNGHSAINSIENNSKSMVLRKTDRGESTDGSKHIIQNTQGLTRHPNPPKHSTFPESVCGRTIMKMDGDDVGDVVFMEWGVTGLLPGC